MFESVLKFNLNSRINSLNPLDTALVLISDNSIEKDGNDSFSFEHKAEIQVFFFKYMSLLICNILNNNYKLELG